MRRTSAFAPYLWLALLLPAYAGDVRLDSYSVERQHLKAPRSVRDVNGQRRFYSDVYIVKLKGDIPIYRAVPVQLFIGDDPIREYGATAGGIYFKVYEFEQLRRWDGKAFRYALRPGELTQTALTFHAEGMK
jgi:hypothetical protein